MNDLPFISFKVKQLYIDPSPRMDSESALEASLYLSSSLEKERI